MAKIARKMALRLAARVKDYESAMVDPRVSQHTKDSLNRPGSLNPRK